MYHRMEKVVLDFVEELLAKQIERNYDALFDQLEHTVVAYSYTLPELRFAGYLSDRPTKYKPPKVFTSTYARSQRAPTYTHATLRIAPETSRRA